MDSTAKKTAFRALLPMVVTAMILLVLTRQAFPQSNTLIVPGSSVGLVKIGDPKDVALRVLGKPDLEGWTREDVTPRYYTWQYYHKELVVLLLHDKVERIFVRNNSFRTKQNLGVGSTLSEVEQALGAPSQRTEGKVGPELAYKSGIRFLFMNDQAIGLEVRPPSRP